ncbi:hypothetical protein GCM10018962_57170 [Dactylosporangium matsuzakiense]|uniref:Uncharacterized protein n=1 Tax=Dactylosporangium matsuzakiense TaxID=53360 RepID=A0A9W6KQS9_9ACTN|nr:hypothetical protein GCM10017581_065230 [Dactylosporangium matsuzakiense]
MGHGSCILARSDTHAVRERLAPPGVDRPLDPCRPGVRVLVAGRGADACRVLRFGQRRSERERLLRDRERLLRDRNRERWGLGRQPGGQAVDPVGQVVGPRRGTVQAQRQAATQSAPDHRRPPAADPRVPA